MNENLKQAIEDAVPGLKIDGVVTTSDAVAVATKVMEATAVIAASVKPDGKVDAADATAVINATISLAPRSSKKALFEHIKKEIRESKTKFDDVLLPAITALQKILNAD